MSFRKTPSPSLRLLTALYVDVANPSGPQIQFVVPANTQVFSVPIGAFPDGPLMHLAPMP